MLVIVALASAGTLTGVLVATGGSDTGRDRVGGEVRSLLAGMPEHGETLGRYSAPVTLVVYGDLKCLTTKGWVLQSLPAIVRRYVRPGRMKTEFRAFKTDTHNSREFSSQQTAAPVFQLGSTGAPLKDFTGRRIVEFAKERPRCR